MTYKEAFDLKANTKPQSYSIDNKEYSLFVAPSDIEDKEGFLAYINTVPVSLTRLRDEDAKKHSKNDLYTVIGLWTNGFDIFHDTLWIKRQSKP